MREGRKLDARGLDPAEERDGLTVGSQDRLIALRDRLDVLRAVERRVRRACDVPLAGVLRRRPSGTPEGAPEPFGVDADRRNGQVGSELPGPVPVGEAVEDVVQRLDRVVVGGQPTSRLGLTDGDRVLHPQTRHRRVRTPSVRLQRLGDLREDVERERVSRAQGRPGGAALVHVHRQSRRTAEGSRS